MARTAIDRRSNGRYRARYQAPDKRWRSRTFDRRLDAQRWLRDELAKVDRAEWVDPKAGRATFGSVAERWMAARVSLRESTKARDRFVLGSLILPYLGAFPIGSIEPSDLDTWIGELGLAGKSPATIRKAWQITSGILRLSVRDRLRSSSPAHDVELPALKYEQPRALTLDEVMALAEAIDPRYRVLVLVGAFGGLRIGELAGLTVADFDPLRQEIHIRRTASDVSGRVIVWTTQDHEEPAQGDSAAFGIRSAGRASPCLRYSRPRLVHISLPWRWTNQTQPLGPSILEARGTGIGPRKEPRYSLAEALPGCPIDRSR